MISQAAAAVEVTSSLGADVLALMALTWNESLAQPFMGHLELVSEDPEIDLATIMNQSISIRLDCRDQSRWLSGIVTQFQSTGATGRLAKYEALVAPSLSLLRYSGGYKIYQNLSAAEIIQQVLSTAGNITVINRLSQTYTPREYCVQYGESDLQFVQRLMEEEGIYYFFDYAQDKHSVVLADDISGHQTVSGYENITFRSVQPQGDDEYINDFRASRKLGTSVWQLNDYDFQKPQSPLLVKQMASGAAAQLSRYDISGGYSTIDQGQRLARIRSEAELAERDAIVMHGSIRALRSGHLFKLQDHPLDAYNCQYLVKNHSLHVTAASLQSGDMTFFDCRISMECQPSTVPYRAPQRTPRPVAYGPHLATVTGKAGEEIWTDSYGRVKVQFPWDLDGKNDEASSCWIRVSQAWVGKNWGAMVLPRIGDEVIVEFLGGNPDEPIIVGRVYNATRMPPDALAGAQAKTIFRTHSTKGGDATSFHELSFDDTKDQEKILFQSERDFSRVVENNDSLSVGFDKKSPGDRTVKIYNNETIQVGMGSGNGSYSLEAAKSIVLKCGSSSIEITPDAIQITSASITIKGNSEVTTQGPNVTVKADTSLKLSANATADLNCSGQVTIKGGMVLIN